jgi:hypothetical protein
MQNRSINIDYSDTVVTGDDTLHVSRSGGWYEVEIYPLDNDAQAINIPTPFAFPAKIELRFTTFLQWVKGRR